MKSTRRITCGVIVMIVILLAVVVPVYAYYRPLGPSLALKIPASENTNNNSRYGRASPALRPGKENAYCSPKFKSP